MPDDLPSVGNSIPFGSGALSDPEMLLAAYFGSSVVGVCILDAELRILAINQRLAEINGLPVADSLGKTVRQVLGDAASLIEPQLQRVFSSGEPVLNFETSGMFPARHEAGRWIGHHLPIKDAGAKVTHIGVVVVETTEQKKMDESTRRLRDQARGGMNRLRALLDVSNILASNWKVQEVFPAISARIRRVLHHEYAGFELHDANTGLLVRQAEDFPLGKGLLTAVPISADNSPGGRSLQERAPLIFSGEQLQGFDAEIAERFLAEGLSSLCCVPLLRPKGPLGVLVLGSTRKDAFQPDDLTLLNQVAALLAVVIENQRAATEISALQQRLGEERGYLEGETRSYGLLREIVGESPALKHVLDQVAIVAPSEATVLILGETGTGKELVARAIHQLSRRQAQSFIKVNCAAIPTGLLESELFGHEKGAFTGAVARKIGRLELANGGTLFLDEVGEIPLELQPKLLRILQDQEFERLGSTRTIKVNLRLIAATNRDLARSVAERHFRNDLFYRLNVFPIRVPPLRERLDDAGALLRPQICFSHGTPHRNCSQRDDAGSDGMVLARQHTGTREPDGTIRDSHRRQGPAGSVVRTACREDPTSSGGRPYARPGGARTHHRRTARDQRRTVGSERRRAPSGIETHHPAIEDATPEDYTAGLFRSAALAALRSSEIQYSA